MPLAANFERETVIFLLKKFFIAAGFVVAHFLFAYNVLTLFTKYT